MLYIDENKMDELKEYVSKRAVDVFLSICNYKKKSIENLKTKKFHMGDYVVFIKQNSYRWWGSLLVDFCRAICIAAEAYRSVF